MGNRPQPPVEIFKAFPEGYRALAGVERAIAAAGLDKQLVELVKIRASQINGCAYCLDMHHLDARAAGETDQRLAVVSAWREVEFFTDTERAALALTEAVTTIATGHVPAKVEAAAREAFDDKGYAALLFAIATINAWNRLAIASHSPAGHYQPGDHG